MEEKQLGKREKELNYIPNYQSPNGEKHSYSTPSVLSSHEKERIATLEQENEEIKISSGNAINETDNDIECKDPHVAEHTVIPEVKYTKVISDKSSDKETEIAEQIHAVKDNNDFNNEQIKASKGQVECVFTNTNKYLLNKVSPIHSLKPNNDPVTTFERKKIIQTTSLEVDYISETYRNIVKQINDVSEGFRRGKKWKCNNPSHCHHHHNHQHYHKPHCRQYTAPKYFASEEIVLERGKDTLLLKQQKIRGMDDIIDVMSGSSFEVAGSDSRERVLVRQMATEHSQEYEPEDIDYYDDDEDIAIVIEPDTHPKSTR